jgi:hypothetical protein
MSRKLRRKAIARIAPIALKNVQDQKTKIFNLLRKAYDKRRKLSLKIKSKNAITIRAIGAFTYVIARNALNLQTEILQFVQHIHLLLLMQLLHFLPYYDIGKYGNNQEE